MRRGSNRSFRCDGAVVVLVLAAGCLSVMVLYSQRFHQSINFQSRFADDASKGPVTIARRTSLLSDLAAPAWSCPLLFERTSYEEVREIQHKPYILGGLQRPECSNCHKDKLWSQFCQFKSHGPACTGWDQWRLLDSFIQRAEAGASSTREMLTLSPCDLFELLEGRTLWLIGDSLTQEFQRAIQCFFVEFWDLETYDPLLLTDDLKAKEAYSKLPSNGWCVFMLRNTNICHLRGNYGDHFADDMFPHLPSLGAVRSDLVLFNFGVWHNDMATFSGNVSRVEAYLREHRSELPFLIWRDTAPQHFDTPLGEFGCDGCPEPEAPYQCKRVSNVTLNAQNQLETNDPAKQVLVEGGWRNKVTAPMLRRLDIPVVEIWNQSMPLWDFHHNFQDKDDCTHMCHPSAYQMWVFQFYEVLRRLQDRLPPVIPKREAPWRPERTMQTQ